MNPIPYPPQLNFPPPPIMAPILLGVPPPPYSLPPPPITALLAPAPPAMQAVAPQVQANVVNAPALITQPIANPAAPITAPMLVAGRGNLIIHHLHLLGLHQVLRLILTICPLADCPLLPHCQYRGRAPHPQVLTGGFHLPDLTSLTDTVAYENVEEYYWLLPLEVGALMNLIMPITYQSIKGDVGMRHHDPWTSHEPV